MSRSSLAGSTSSNSCRSTTDGGLTGLSNRNASNGRPSDGDGRAHAFALEVIDPESTLEDCLFGPTGEVAVLRDPFPQRLQTLLPAKSIRPVRRGHVFQENQTATRDEDPQDLPAGFNNRRSGSMPVGSPPWSASGFSNGDEIPRQVSEKPRKAALHHSIQGAGERAQRCDECLGRHGDLGKGSR